MAEQLHDGHDFVVRSNAENAVIDYLLFLDSRRISYEFDYSLADKLICRISQLGKTYLCVCRPLEMIIWAIQIGFLAHNKGKPSQDHHQHGYCRFHVEEAG